MSEVKKILDVFNPIFKKWATEKIVTQFAKNCVDEFLKQENMKKQTKSKTKVKIDINEIINFRDENTIVFTLKTKKGKWEVFKYERKNHKSEMVKLFGNRLLAKNGKVVCSNKDFNSKANAIKNIHSVIDTCK